MTAPRRHAALLLALLLASSACIPEPTPHVERPVDLEPPPLFTTTPEEELEPFGLPTGALAAGVLGKAALGLLERPLQLSENLAPEADILPKSLTLFVTANVRAELNLCDCRVPRGGLARRAALLERLRASADEIGERAPIVLDVGDALASVVAPPPSNDDFPAVERAATLIEIYGALGVDAMLVNLRDLRMGSRRLIDAAREHDLPLISSNLRVAETGEPLVEPHLVIERDGLRLGLVGLTPSHRSDPRFLDKQGLQLTAPRDALAESTEALREEGVDAILLLSGLGMRDTTNLLGDWDEDASARPDLVLVSGSARLTRQPTWEGGVALLEPGEGGRQILLLTLVPDEEGALNLSKRGGDRLEAQGEMLAALRRFSASWTMLERDAFNVNRKHSLDTKLRELKTRVEALSRLQGALRGGPAEDVVPGFGVEIVELSEGLEPDADIQRRVDAVEREDEVPREKVPRIRQQRLMKKKDPIRKSP